MIIWDDQLTLGIAHYFINCQWSKCTRIACIDHQNQITVALHPDDAMTYLTAAIDDKADFIICVDLINHICAIHQIAKRNRKTIGGI